SLRPERRPPVRRGISSVPERAGSETGAPRLPSLPLQRLQAPGDFLGVGAAVKGRDAEKALAVFPETAAGRDDHVCFIQNGVEGLPTGGTRGRLRPDVGRVHAAIDLKAGAARAFAQHLRVAQVMFNQ